MTAPPRESFCNVYLDERWCVLPDGHDGPCSAHSRVDVFSLCGAYESGIGHGLARDGLCNPYPPASDDFRAYEIGYEEGARRELSNRLEGDETMTAPPREPTPDPRYCHHPWEYSARYVGCVLHCGKPQPPRIASAPPAADAVQRWTSAQVAPNDAGGFVAYGDYLTLRATFERQAREIARIRACNATGDSALAEVVAERDALRECVLAADEVAARYAIMRAKQKLPSKSMDNYLAARAKVGK